jgi:succinate-acetate transporter protein
LGAAVPYGLTCLIFAAAGIFGNFWFWTVDYARAYTSQVQVEHAWAGFRTQAMDIGGSGLLIWMLKGLGLIFIVWDRDARARWVFVVLFVLFSFLAICPGFYFRPHYFVLILPAAALLAGIAISGMANALSKLHSRFLRYGLPGLAAIVCLTVAVYQQRDFLFQMSSAEACRST